MTLPLVVLAGLAIVGGGLNLPFTDDLNFLEHWLEPVLERNERVIDVATGTKVGLAVDRRRSPACSASPPPSPSTSRSA